MRRVIAAMTLIAACLLAAPAVAVLPDEVLDDPALEARARSISTNLRCLVCQNQSIDDSDAPLARDLRILVRERLEAGDSDSEVVAYLVDRYGEFVLLRPRFAPHTLVLWAAPVVLLAGGTAAVWIAARHRRRRDPAELTEAERRRIEELLDAKE